MTASRLIILLVICSCAVWTGLVFAILLHEPGIMWTVLIPEIVGAAGTIALARKLT